MLVSADFGRELMTAVLWLNRFEGMDISPRPAQGESLGVVLEQAGAMS
jgi:hypothetical protein